MAADPPPIPRTMSARKDRGAAATEAATTSAKKKAESKAAAAAAAAAATAIDDDSRASSPPPIDQSEPFVRPLLDYERFQHNLPLLYDCFIHSNLEWPSYACACQFTPHTAQRHEAEADE